MLRNFVILAGLLLHASCELVLLKKGEDVYCVSKDVQDKALAWTVGMNETRNLNISYGVTGDWSKWVPQENEFQHLNCNPMKSENCGGWTNFVKWTRKTVTWTDDYGLVLDQRWNDFPVHVGVNNTAEIIELPSANLRKFYVNLSVLSKSCVRLIFFNKENTMGVADPGKSGNKFVFSLDCIKGNFSLALGLLIYKNDIRKPVSDTAGKNESAFLNHGESWTNIRMVYEMTETGYATWKINEEMFTIQPAHNINFTHFAIRAYSNTFYWKHHSDYTILETDDVTSPLQATIEANHERDSKLCISIMYVGAGNLTLSNLDANEGGPATVTLPNHNNWTSFHHVFDLDKGKKYKLIIQPLIDALGDIRKFSLGNIRVCNEKEYTVSKYQKYKTNNVTACGVLNDTYITTKTRKQLNSPFVFPCEKGYFGANCDMKCSDIDGLNDWKSVIVCNSKNCSCLPGYHGYTCSKECEAYKYGVQCEHKCGNCDEDKQCFHANGSCPGNVCAAGFYGAKCEIKCSTGKYGKNCDYNCSENCKYGKDNCYNTNGTCRDGCQTVEYRPPTCHHKRATVKDIKLTENGADSVQIDVDVDVDDIQWLKSYQVQVRNQSKNDWETNKNESWMGVSKSITLTVNNLKPKTTYEIRVLLTEQDNNFFENKNTLKVNTLCKPATGKEEFKISRDDNLKTIEIQLVNATQNGGNCILNDYDIYLNDKKVENVTAQSNTVKFEKLNGSVDGIIVKIQQKFNQKVKFEFNQNENGKITGKADEGTKGRDNTGTIIGILLFLILAGIVVGFVIHRKHQLTKSRVSVLFRRSVIDDTGESSPTIAAVPARPDAPAPAGPAPDLIPAANTTTTPHTCRVAVSNLQSYIDQAVISGLLKSQHALFPRGQTQPWDEGRKPEHRGKNRYGNLVAYDHTRVVLQTLTKQPHSHYINANYIDGYNAPKYYIATQGPKESTLNDFWRMIWQENVRVIVMLANLVEDGKTKCEKYWPNLETKTQCGNITIRTVSDEEFLDYTTREFEVICGKQTRKVLHLHYTVWPDHDVPRYPHSLAKFIRIVNEVATQPTVVHCSAGVGRTGTIILAHASYKMAKSENAVDCLALVSKMRSQRPNMVDNKEQYEIAHHLLTELLIIGDTSISSEKFAPTFRRLRERHELPRQYAILNEASAKDAGNAEEIAWPKDRSRFPFIVPGNEKRVPLEQPEGGSDFINAVLVDGVRSKSSYIATQLPLPGTRGHFWSMVFQHASAVLLLNRPDPLNDKSAVALWHDYDELKVTRTLRVKIKQEITRPLFDTVSIELICDELNKGTWKTGRRTIPVVCMKTWPTRNILPNKAEDLVQVWHEMERLRDKDLQIVVACYDGATACGLFLAAAHMFEEMKATRKVDVVNSVRCIRHSRSQFVSTLDQFRFLHDLVLSYLEMFDSYANF